MIATATPWLARRLGFHDHDIGRTLVITGTVLGILAILTLEVSSWAIAYLLLNVAANFSDALFLSPAIFSTAGYGEIHPAASWRLIRRWKGSTAS